VVDLVWVRVLGNGKWELKFWRFPQKQNHELLRHVTNREINPILGSASFFPAMMA
jgi:hypothetical protein